MKKVIIVFLIILVFPFMSADVISLNSGGSPNIIINSDTYIEGFFFCVPTNCTILDYECGTWPDGCGGTLDCGTCASGYTCTSGNCVAEEVPPDGEPGGEPGGGVITPTVNIAVDPSEISLTMAINTAVDRIIEITNLETSQVTVSVRQSGLDNMVILGETSLQLASGETKNLNVRFVAPGQPGIFTGKILIGSRQVLVSLNVKTKLLLFDSNIVVLNKDYKVAQGNKLKTQVTLIPLGDEERLDVTLNYEIKDYDGEIHLTQSETVLVERQMNFKRNFDTGMLSLGKYIVGLELVYPGGVAPSSAHFEIVERIPIDFGNLVFYLIIAIFMVAILIVILLIIRKRKQASSQGQS